MQTKTVALLTRVSPEKEHRVRIAAAEMGFNKSQFLSHLIDEYLERPKAAASQENQHVPAS